MKTSYLVGYDVMDQEGRKSLVLFAKERNYMTFHGSGLETSVVPGTEYLTSIPFEIPEHFDNALIACTICEVNNKGDVVLRHHSFIFVSSGGERGVEVALDETFMSWPGRIAHVENSGIVARVSGQLVASFKKDEALLTDASLLCKWANNHAEATNEVLLAATSGKDQATELAEIKQELEECRKNLGTMTFAKKTLEEQKTRMIANHQEEVKKWRVLACQFWGFIFIVNGIIQNRWFVPKDAKNYISAGYRLGTENNMHLHDHNF